MIKLELTTDQFDELYKAVKTYPDLRKILDKHTTTKKHKPVKLNEPDW
jgi:hypothetical protein|tara:strand:- start:7912 stop:8055 length:144 start_codon:yes stop_codon:yes gene_type:complete